MESYQALYYPYVHFKNDAWVKLSALYWDKLKRIVPKDYPTDDSVTVRDLGTFIETVRPDAVKSAFAKTFSDFFASYGAQLQKTYALANRDQWPAVPLAQRPPTAGGPSGIDMRLGYVRYEKINDDVYRSMQEHGLASTDERGAKWIGMHPRLSSGPAALCARALSLRRVSLPPEASISATSLWQPAPRRLRMSHQ